MTASLLSTKFYIPKLRENHIPRPELVERLDAGLRHGNRFCLISAPAGYGKTTLVVEWLDELIKTGANVTWLTLDQGDDDPVKFWLYLLTSLKKIPSLEMAGFGDAAIVTLQSQESIALEPILTSLINELSDLPQRIILVLDDLHLVNDRTIHSGLVYLLENMPLTPHGIHFVIVTRQDPPWPMARLRAYGEVTEIRTSDLRFSTDEAAHFIDKQVGFALAKESMSVLDRRVEGWIAGLQMVAITIRTRAEMLGERGVVDYIDSISGSHRYVIDFLMEEVLGEQEPEIQEFLLKSSILDHLTASLCDSVCFPSDRGTKRPSIKILNYLEQANLFLLPLDDRREWYRYHTLFVDLLRSRLLARGQKEITLLHNRASSWYEANGWVAEAINHAYAADNTERVAKLIESNAFTMLDRGALARKLNWLEKIPDKVRQSNPWLGVAEAWLRVYSGQIAEAERTIETTEQSMGSVEPDQRQRIDGQLDAIQAYANWMRGLGVDAITYARLALDKLPQGELTVRALAATTLAGGLIHSDEPGAAVGYLREAMLWSRESGSVHVIMLAAGMYAYLLIQQGKLVRAQRICEEALDTSSGRTGSPYARSPAEAQVHCMLSLVHLERYEFDQSMRHANESLALSKDWAQADTLTLSYVYLADVLLESGDYETARQVIKQARREGAHVSRWFEDIINRLEAEYNLRIGNLQSLNEWAEKISHQYQEKVPQPRRNSYITLAKVLINQGRLNEGLHLLDDLIVPIEKSGATLYLISVLILQSIIHNMNGNVEQARSIIEKALKLAEQENLIRRFVSAGEAIIPVLELAVERRVTPEFNRRILGLIGRKQLSAQKEPGSERSSRPRVITEHHERMVEPLTEREYEVLRWLNSNLSVPEIAQELYISVSTVRTHIKNIYGKLDAHSRISALQRAKDFRLI